MGPFRHSFHAAAHLVVVLLMRAVRLQMLLRVGLWLATHLSALPTGILLVQGERGGLDSGRAWLGFGLSVLSMLAATSM